MLVSFSVENFRSFGEEVTLSMVASNKLTDHPEHKVPIGDTGQFALRSALLYGANAAGKSNFIRAIHTAQRLILDPSERRIAPVPFRFSPHNQKPISFEFRILIDARVFVYGFDILANKIISEWLCVMHGEEEVTLFERDDKGAILLPDNNHKFFGDDRSLKTLEQLRGLQTRNEQLVLNRILSVADSEQGDTLRSILRWFSDALIVLPASSRSTPILERLHDDEWFRSLCAKFLENVGTGVSKLDFDRVKRPASEWESKFLQHYRANRLPYPYGTMDVDIIPNNDDSGTVTVRRLLSSHLVSPETYNLAFSEESDGTQELLKLMPVLASSPNETKVIVLDELDRSLHPLLCWEFVRFFSESCPDAARQIIVTTHEAHLLNQELLRRDEYWFVEKDDRQQTQLVSLMDFNIRKDLKVERGYLQGRFGAIPIIGGMNELEALLKCPHTEK